jgi:quinol monooxygenase YgiN
MKHAVLGTIEVKPGTRNQALPAVLAHRERSLRDEPGTLQFEVLVPNHDPDKIHLFEVYADSAAFVIHMKGASMVKVNQEAGHLLVSLTGIQCVLASELADGPA